MVCAAGVCGTELPLQATEGGESAVPDGTGDRAYAVVPLPPHHGNHPTAETREQRHGTTRGKTNDLSSNFRSSCLQNIVCIFVIFTGTL